MPRKINSPFPKSITMFRSKHSNNLSSFCEVALSQYLSNFQTEELCVFVQVSSALV